MNLENLIDGSFSVREISDIVAKAAFRMSGEERKAYIERCNNMISVYKAKADSAVEECGNVPEYDYPAAVSECVAEAERKIYMLQVARDYFVFPQMKE